LRGEKIAAMLPDQRRAARIFGVIAGATVGIETLFPEAMCCGGTLTGTFFMFTLPGMFASGMIVGNIHAYPTWLAAIVNALLYYVLGSLLWKVITSVARRMRGINSN
jgi:hypothetical protein